eukprot:gene16763-23036_t
MNTARRKDRTLLRRKLEVSNFRNGHHPGEACVTDVDESFAMFEAGEVTSSEGKMEVSTSQRHPQAADAGTRRRRSRANVEWPARDEFTQEVTYFEKMEVSNFATTSSWRRHAGTTSTSSVPMLRPEVTYFEKMEVSNFRNDIILAEACRDDVDEFCPDVEAGEGRVHKCLRDNRKKLSDKCRTEELKLEEIENESVELSVGLLKVAAGWMG